MSFSISLLVAAGLPRRRSPRAAVVDLLPEWQTVLLLVVLWIALIAFYLLFFYAVGRSPADPESAKASPADATASVLALEHLPEWIETDENRITIDRPDAIVVEDAARIETTESRIVLHEPVRALVDGDRVLVLDRPASIAIADSGATLHEDPGDVLPALEAGQTATRHACVAPERVTIDDPDAVSWHES